MPYCLASAALGTPAAAFTAREFPGAVNRVTYDFNRFTAVAYGGMINKSRRETLDLPPMSRSATT
jgi:sterol 3beta-glucosyltransferase